MEIPTYSTVPKSFICNQNFPCLQDTYNFDHGFFREVQNDDGEIKMLAKKKFQYNNKCYFFKLSC